MKRILLLTLFVVASLCFAEVSPVVAYATKAEAEIRARVEKETMPRRRVQMEYMSRQDYALRLEDEQNKMIRSGRLTTPEVERLKAERDALFEQITAFEKAIEKASLEAPEVKELQAVMKANEERIEALRIVLMPESLRKAYAPKESNP